jgi:glycine reductase
MSKSVICYINQFFAGVGGEEKAGIEPYLVEGTLGPTMAIDKALAKADAHVTYTIVCGDNFMGSNTDEAVARIIDMIKDKPMDAFVAGPAFQAGRYTVACGAICKAVQEKFHVPAVTSFNVETPGVDMYKKDVIIFKGGNSAAKMRKDVPAMINYLCKVLNGEPTLGADAEGYFARGMRKEVFLENKHENTAAYRGVDMLIKKIKGEPYQTELIIPEKDVVPIADPIADLSKANIALVTSGGIVPVDNPDRIQSASATRWGRYDVSKLDSLPNRAAGGFKTIHAGYDPAAADADPNVCVPLDAMRAYEKEGKIGKLHPYFYSTVGTGTTEGEAARMAAEMIPFLKEDGVDGIIVGST